MHFTLMSRLVDLDSFTAKQGLNENQNISKLFKKAKKV